MKQLVLFQVDNNLIPIGYSETKGVPSDKVIELSKLLTSEDYNPSYLKKCLLNHTATGYEYLTDSSRNPVYPTVLEAGKACFTVQNDVKFRYSNSVYDLNSILQYNSSLFKKYLISEPVSIPTPSESDATKGVAEDKTQGSSNSDIDAVSQKSSINLNMEDAFNTIFGKIDEVIDYLKPNQENDTDNNFTEEQIISNYENLLPIELLKELYSDKYDTAISQGYFVNNSSLSYTIKKLRTIFDDSYIINSIIPKIESNIEIVRLVLNSINSIDDIDKLLKGHKILLKHNFNIQLVEATYIEGEIKLYSGNTELDKSVIINMLQNGLQNYNVALDKYKSIYEKIYDLNEKLLCPEFLVLPFNSSQVIGLVVTNCYITMDNEKYFIPIKGIYLDIIKDLHFTEPIKMKNRNIDVDALSKYVRVVSVSSIPSDLKMINDIDDLILKLRDIEEFSNVTLLPELINYKNLINKELC